MTDVHVGDAVESLTVLRANGGMTIPAHAVGTVTYVYQHQDRFDVSYSGEPYCHVFSRERKTWRLLRCDHRQKVALSHENPQMIIQSEGVMELYRAQSTETIEGVVPQVKYGETIVWQGPPVPSTFEDDGKDAPLDAQHNEALKAANKRITEVVKRQFQE